MVDWRHAKMKKKPSLLPTHSGSFPKRILLFISGLFILSFGIVLMIQAQLGVNPWDVLHIGLSNQTGLSIGVWVQLVGVTIIVLTSLLAKQWSQIGMIINILCIGFFINILLQLNIIPTVQHFLLQLIVLLIGIMCMGFGIGMYVASNLGPGPRDWLTLVLVKKTGWSIAKIRTMIEGTALILGWIAGGPIFIGTFLSVFLIGPFMQLSLQFWIKQLLPPPQQPYQTQTLN